MVTIQRKLTAQTILGTVAILRDRDKEHPCNVDGPRNVDYTTDYDLSNLYLAGQMRLYPVPKGV